MCLFTVPFVSDVTMLSIIIYRGISAPGHGKEVVDGLNDVDKRYIDQLMSTVKLPVSIRFGSQIQMHTCTKKYDVSLAKKFQEHLTKNQRKDSFIDQGKHIKKYMKRKWTDR